MSEIQGNNPATGTANPSPEDKAKTIAKGNARDAKAEQDAANKLDRGFIRGLVAAEKLLASIGDMMDQVILTNAHKMFLSDKGKPFTSPQAYFTARVAEHCTDEQGKSILSIALSKAVCAMMRERGVSVRKAAAATGISTGAASESDKPEGHRKAATAGDGKSDADKASDAKAELVKLVKSVAAANTSVRGNIDKLAPGQLASLRKDYENTLGKVVAKIKIFEAAQARQAKVAEAAGKPASEPVAEAS